MCGLSLTLIIIIIIIIIIITLERSIHHQTTTSCHCRSECYIRDSGRKSSVTGRQWASECQESCATQTAFPPRANLNLFLYFLFPGSTGLV